MQLLQLILLGLVSGPPNDQPLLCIRFGDNMEVNMIHFLLGYSSIVLYFVNKCSEMKIRGSGEIAQDWRSHLKNIIILTP